MKPQENKANVYQPINRAKEHKFQIATQTFSSVVL